MLDRHWAIDLAPQLIAPTHPGPESTAYRWGCSLPTRRRRIPPWRARWQWGRRKTWRRRYDSTTGTAPGGVNGENEANDSKKEIRGRTAAVDSRRRERLVKEKMRRGSGRWESPVQRFHLESISLRGWCSLETTPSWEPILTALPKMEPRRVSRSAEQTAVGG